MRAANIHHGFYNHWIRCLMFIMSTLSVVQRVVCPPPTPLHLYFHFYHLIKTLVKILGPTDQKKLMLLL